jgi:ubiquinol-cytochrome c reductase cytochrome c1 subunit
MFFQNYQIRNKHLINIFTFIILLLSPQVVLGAGDSISYPENNWSFSGITGTFDRASQQRGLQVYKEVCSGCHGLRLVAYRNLKALGYNDDEVKAFAAENSVNDINDEGETI